MILLIDIGNTRIKWATSDGESLEQQQAVAHAQWTRAECVAAFNSLSRPTRVLVSNVGGAKIATLLCEAATELWQIEPEFIRSTATAAGITNAYPDPSKLGVDRWLALIGAYAMHRRSLCIVGVGTATTIDGIDATGKHLGGLIVPGPDLMVESLLHNTSDIARHAERGSVGTGVFADNTLGAIRQGSWHATAALTERAFDALKLQTGETPLLLFTGGASTEVARLVRYPHTNVADLVLRGLVALASSQAAV